MTPPEAIQDSEPEPWKAERLPDPSAAELRLKLASIGYSKAKAALEGFTGARTGSDNQRLLIAHRDTGAELLAAAIAFATEQTA